MNINYLDYIKQQFNQAQQEKAYDKSYDNLDLVNGLNTSYDEQLKKINIYKVHPELLPFVGEMYDLNQILLVGESHYIRKEDSKNLKALENSRDKWYTDEWFNVTDHPLLNSFGYYITRRIVLNFMNGCKQKTKFFSNVLKEYPSKNPLEDCGKVRFNDFAFMNYMQIPSYKYGSTIFNQATEYDYNIAKETLENVIEVLQPEKVIFLSKGAYDKFKNNNETDKNLIKDGVYPKIDWVYHPTCRWWHRKITNENKPYHNKEYFHKIIKS